MSLHESAQAGSRLQSLIALRDVIASQIDACDSARDVAALSQRFMDVLTQIDALDAGPAEEATALDELTKRRESRASGAAGVTGAKVGKQRG